jgi:hypothetical protein
LEPLLEIFDFSIEGLRDGDELTARCRDLRMAAPVKS